jgi:hypothetical protein
LKLNGKVYYGGYFDNEEHAAMRVNLLCDEYEKKHKNLTIDIELHVTAPKVIHSLFINMESKVAPFVFIEESISKSFSLFGLYCRPTVGSTKKKC